MVSGATAADDATSASQSTIYARTLLTVSQAVYGSGAAYAADLKSVVDFLQGITENVDALTNSFVAQQPQSQTATLVQTLQDNTTSLKGEIAALRREIQ